MSKLTDAAHAGLAGTFALLNATAAAEPIDARSDQLRPTQGSTFDPEGKKISITYGAREGCELLQGGACNGKADYLKLQFPNGTGDLTFTVRRYEDRDARTLLSHSWGYKFSDPRYGHAGGHAEIEAARSAEVTGTAFAVDKSFALTPRLMMQFGIYGGQLEGKMAATARAGATLDAYSMTSPTLTYRGYMLPPMTVAGEGGSIGIEKSWIHGGKTYYGGLTQAAGWSIPVTDKLQVGLSQHAQLGVDNRMLGVGGELIWSSEPDAKLGARPGGSCNGGSLASSAHYAFTVGVCGWKQNHVQAYHERKHSGSLAERVNAKTAELQAQMDDAYARGLEELPPRAAEYIDSRVDVPRVATNITEDQMLGFLGGDTRARDLKTSLVMGSSIRLSPNTVVSLTHTRMVGGSAYDRGRHSTSVELRHEF